MKQSVVKKEKANPKQPVPPTFSLHHHHYQEQLQDFKGELEAVRQSVLSMSTSDAGDLAETISGLDKEIFDVSIQIKEFLYPHKDSIAPPDTTPTTTHGVRLPKLDVPTFDGDILNWSTFWEQFCIAVHDRTHLSDAEKWVQRSGCREVGLLEALTQRWCCKEHCGRIVSFRRSIR